MHSTVGVLSFIFRVFLSLSCHIFATITGRVHRPLRKLRTHSITHRPANHFKTSSIDDETRDCAPKGEPWKWRREKNQLREKSGTHAHTDSAFWVLSQSSLCVTQRSTRGRVTKEGNFVSCAKGGKEESREGGQAIPLAQRNFNELAHYPFGSRARRAGGARPVPCILCFRRQ